MTGAAKSQRGSVRDVAAFVSRHLGADMRRVWFFSTGMLGHVVLTVASTRLIGDAVEEANKGASLGRLGWSLAEILAALFGAVVLRWFADRSINRHTAEAMATIVKAGFAKVQAFDTGWHADNFAGATARKVTRAAQGYDVFVSCCYFFFLPSLLLSGYMFPFRGMPGWAQAIGEALPLTHFLRVVRGILLKGNGLPELMPDLWPMLLFLVIMLTIGIKRYRQTLD